MINYDERIEVLHGHITAQMGTFMDDLVAGINTNANDGFEGVKASAAPGHWEISNEAGKTIIVTIAAT